MATLKCSECKYACGPIPVAGHEAGQYFCHRFPPHRHVPEWHGVFPLVRDCCWCGEHKPGTPTPPDTGDLP